MLMWYKRAHQFSHTWPDKCKESLFELDVLVDLYLSLLVTSSIGASVCGLLYVCAYSNITFRDYTGHFANSEK